MSMPSSVPRVRTTLGLVSPLPPRLRKLSYRVMAERTGLNHNRLYRQLSGRTPLQLDTIGRLSCAYGIPLDKLVQVVPLDYTPHSHPPAYSDHLQRNEPTDLTADETDDDLPADPTIGLMRSTPWVITPAYLADPPALTPAPVWPPLHLQTPAAIERAELIERDHAWGEYRYHAAAGNLELAVAAIQEELKLPKGVSYDNPGKAITKACAKVVAHLREYTPTPDESRNSIARFVRSQDQKR